MTPAPTKAMRSTTVSAMQPSVYPPPSGPPPQLPPGHPSHPSQFHSMPAFQPQQYQQYVPQQGYHPSSYQQQPILQGYPTYQQDTRSSLVPASAAAPPPISTGPLRPASAERQESWSDGGWRAIFDAALVKAQQAVQLDELGESSTASGLYQQAANDLGRVIPLCGSEKKKQSMLAIQAIYLDRVLQLKNPQSKKTEAEPALAPASAPTPSRIQPLPQALPAPIPTSPQSNGQGMGAYGLEDEDEETYQPQDDYLLAQYQQYNMTQFQHQQLYQQQQQPQDMDRGLTTMGKKRSMTQPSAPHPPEFLQQCTMTAYNGFDDPSYGEYSSGSYNPASFNGATATPSPPPPALSVPSIFKTDVKEEQESSKSSSSRWKPFGKKKSKSFSHSEPQPSGPYVPPNDYEIPVPAFPNSILPLESTQGTMNSSVPNHFGMDPLKHNSSYASQHAGWFMGESESPLPDENGFKKSNIYIDDEDEGVDPYYIADTKGRAHAFEGKNDSKTKAAPPKEVAVAPLRIKPATQHTGASFASDKPFSPTFSPQEFRQQQDRSQSFGYAQEPIQGTYYSQESVDMQSNDLGHIMNHQNEDSLEYYQHQHLQQRQQQLHDQQQVQQQLQQQLLQQQYQSQQQQEYQPQQQQQQQHQQQEQSQQQPQQPQQNGSTHGRDLEMMLSITSTPGLGSDFVLEAEQRQESVEQDESKSKRNWFGKKKKKDSTPAPADKLDDVAKLMDEALFGGSTSSSSRKNKDKSKEVDETPAPMMAEIQEVSTPTATGPFIAPRKDSLVEYEGRLSYTGGHASSVDAGSKEDPRHTSYVKERTRPPVIAPIQAAHISHSDTLLPSAADPMSLPLAMPPIQAPVKYSPRTTYIPSPKKQPTHVEEVVSTPMSLTSGLPEYNPESAQLQGSDALLSEPLSPTTDSLKKTKAKPFNLFKSKKSNSSKLSLEQDPGTPLSPTFNSFGEDARSMHSDKKSSVHSNDRRAAVDPVPTTKDIKKKRESDEYVPYEYQEELEGPLMERVEVPENRDVIGFVMPVEEIIDYTLEGNEDAALDNWDSWVNQLESFEKVLSDKGMKKDKGKKAKKSKKDKEKEKQEALAAAAAVATAGTNSSSSSPFSSLKANRSSIFGSSTGRQSTSTAFDDDPHRRQSSVSQGDESTPLSHRHSFQSSRSTVILDGEQVHVLQAKKRWWNPKRKETTSMYSVSDTFSVSETDQERYLSTLLQNHQDQQRPASGDSSQTKSADLPANDTEREDALAALLENSKEVMSLPIPAILSPSSSFATTQEIEPFNDVGMANSYEHAPAVTTTPEPTPIVESTERLTTTVAKEPQTATAATIAPKVKAAKSNKPKLLPISTPLAQILEISNPEELWQYVQQAKTYAATRMNKGDKRSAAIALKRAQALESRWQEILLEMASSDEEDDELLDDDDDDDEDEDDSNEEDTPTAVAPSKVPTASLVVAPVITTAVPSAPLAPAESDGEDVDRSRILRPPTSRSDSAPDMYSKYKVINKLPQTPKDESSPAEKPVEANKDDCLSGDDGRLGPEATMDEMLASTNKDHLQFYIQRLKTDTVAKARKGSKFAALEGMKNVKVLQQRLNELEEQSEEGAVEAS